MKPEDSRLIVGLGNPGLRYVATRHNVGYLVTDAFARKEGWQWKEEKRFMGRVSKGKVGERTVHMLQPTTFMNLSGKAVRAYLHYYRILPGEVLVVTDDVALPLGELRIKPEGSAGGHNGLQSIHTELGTGHYPRLRVGIGQTVRGEMKNYVLEPFTASERETLPGVVQGAVNAVQLWLEEEMQLVMNQVNRRLRRNHEE